MVYAMGSGDSGKSTRFYASTPKQGRAKGKYTPKQSTVTDAAKARVARRGGSDVAKVSKPAPRVIKGTVIKDTGKEVAKRGGSEVAKRGAGGLSKAYKAGRLVRVGGGPVLAAAAAWEIAQAGKRNIENKKEQGYGYGSSGVGASGYNTPAFTKVQAAAKRRSTTLDERRAERMKTGTFRGKHYGPEAFKGDIKMLKAYRSAGSPKDKAEFAKDFKKKHGTGKGWQGTQNKGQGAGDQWRKESRTFENGKWSGGEGKTIPSKNQQTKNKIEKEYRASTPSHGVEMERRRRATS